MTIADEARAEAEQYCPPTHEGLVPHWVRAQRSAFVAGAEWHASRNVEVTDGRANPTPLTPSPV